VVHRLQRLNASLATTGARLGEAFQFGREEIKAGIRCVTIGTKSDGSLRTIPLPADLLKHLSAKITKPLFPMLEATEDKTAAERSASAASKRLNRFLRDIGITDARKVGRCRQTGRRPCRSKSRRDR
jgi:integrase